MKIRLSFLVLLLMLFVGVSCQEEANEETPPNQEETITPDSSLASAMRNTAANDGSADNIMDDSDCFTVNLPVTIVANGITLTIESIDDLSLIEAIFNENTNDEDDIEFLFPIIIILNDYTEINIDSVEELNAFIETCVANEDVIECVDFVYPIVFSIYDTNFQVIDTVEINNDYEMYIFLDGLESGNQGTLASLNFPVSLTYVNGNTVEVTNNQELEEAINAANENCTDNSPFNCFEDTTVTACDFDNDGFTTFELETLLLGSVTCTASFAPSFHISQTNAEDNVNPIVEPNAFVNTLANQQSIYLRIEDNNGDFEVFEVNLIVEDCSSSCSEQNLDTYLLQDCRWNIVNFNGSNDLVTYDLYFNTSDIVIIVGNGMTIDGTWSTSQSGSDTILEFSNVSGPDIQAISGSWIITSCDESNLEMTSVNGTDTMVMEIDCSVCDNPDVLTNDLIIYMPFGNEVRDLIGGTVINDFNLTEDRAGNATCAVSFDGNSSFTIPVTSQNQLVQSDNFSISLWFKMQNTDAGNLEILFRKPGDATVGFNLGVYDLNTPLFGDNLGTYLWDNDWNQEVDVQWDNTDWHHLVVTVDSNNTVRLYRDSVLRNINENSNLSIGSGSFSEYILGEGFQGHMDDLRVYKRALSDNEVGDLYNLEADCYNCL